MSKQARNIGRLASRELERAMDEQTEREGLALVRAFRSVNLYRRLREASQPAQAGGPTQNKEPA